jgi:hypothetical protein
MPPVTVSERSVAHHDAEMESGPRPSRRAARLAWALCVLSVAFGVTTIILALVNGTSLRDFVVHYAALGPFVGVTSPLLGALIVTRYPGNRIGWILCALGLGLAVDQFANEYARYALLTRPGSLPGGAAALWFYNLAWMPVFGLLPFLFLLFPDGRLRSRRWRPVAWTAAVLLAVPPALIAVLAWPHRGPGMYTTETYVPGTDRWVGVVSALDTGFFLGTAVVIAASMAAVLVRLRRARGIERQQVKWLLYGGGVAVAITAVGGLFPVLETGVGSLLTFAGLLGAIAVAIFRYRLYDIDRIINRTLVYALLSATLGLGYAGVVLALGQVLGQERSGLAVAGATLAMAALFQPLRRRIQDAVDRRFNRRRYDAARTIAAFSARLREEIDLDSLTAELLAVVDHTIQPTQAWLWLRPQAASRTTGGPVAPRPMSPPRPGAG